MVAKPMGKRRGCLVFIRGTSAWSMLAVILQFAGHASGQANPAAPLDADRPAAAATDSQQATISDLSQSLHYQLPVDHGQDSVNDSLTYDPKVRADEFDLGGLVQRTLGISMVLGAVCIGCLWWSHSRGGKYGVRDAARKEMQILETISVAPRCYLHLVKVQDQQFLVTRDATGFKTVAAVSSFESAIENSRADFAAEPAAGLGMTDDRQRRGMQWTDPLSHR